MFHRRPIRRLAALVAAAAAAAAPGTAAAAAEQPDPPTLTLRALTGPTGGTLDIGAAAAAFDHVHLRLYAPNAPADAEPETINLKGVELAAGATTLQLGAVARGTRIVVQAQSKDGGRTHVSRGSTVAKLRPDVAVVEVRAPAQTLSVRPVDIEVELEELNDDTATSVDVSLLNGTTPVAPAQRVEIAAGATVEVAFPGILLPAAVATTLRVVVTAAAPAETDEANNSAEATIDVTRHELVRANVLVDALGGYGAQFNNHVYAPITGLPETAFPDLETAVRDFEPQLVRIFYNENFEEVGPPPRYDPANIVSFRRAVGLAQATGATINITYQAFGDARLAPRPHMQRFAAELEYLVEVLRYTNVRWVTVANEPNSPGNALTLAQWETLHRSLHAELVTRGIADHVRIMGGDLVESSGARDHELWFEYMTTNMADIVDAYSEHVYWWYDTFNLEGAWRFQFRLRDIRKLVFDDNPEATRRPAYIMEFAVRGLNSVPGKPTVTNHEYYEDGTEMRRTNVAAFQQLWFSIASAQLGFAGAAKWDLYWGKYDFTNPPNQSYWMVNRTADGWEVFPSYHALRLLNTTTERGWQVVRVDPWTQDDWDPLVRDQPEQELAAYVGPDGRHTILGLDTHGSVLNTASETSSSYSIGGLPANTNFTLVVWNGSGDGTNAVAGGVPTNAAGVARFSVPLHAAFALTTVPVG